MSIGSRVRPGAADTDPDEGVVQGKPVARRGRKARGLAGKRDGPAAASPRATRHGDRPDMSHSIAPGRIRWAVLCLALIAALLPAGSALAAGAGAIPIQVIVQMDAGVSPAKAKAQLRADGGRVTGDLHIING